MKIWKAELILFYIFDKKWNVKFTFEKQDEDYEINKYTNDEWTHSEGWIMDRIPMNMILCNFDSGLKIIQGFDYELNKDQLENLEAKMRKFMTEKLNYNKEKYLKDYNEKIKIINNGDE